MTNCVISAEGFIHCESCRAGQVRKISSFFQVCRVWVTVLFSWSSTFSINVTGLSWLNLGFIHIGTPRRLLSNLLHQNVLMHSDDAFRLCVSLVHTIPFKCFHWSTMLCSYLLHTECVCDLHPCR